MNSAKSLNDPAPKPASAFCARPCLLLLTVCLMLPSGCVSKGRAKRDAQTAYVAGQHEAFARMNQLQGPRVTVLGEVQNQSVAWSPGLTLAQAILAANYYGAADPPEIVLIREGIQMPVDPARLLRGEDIPVEAGDIVRLLAPAAPPQPSPTPLPALQPER